MFDFSSIKLPIQEVIPEIHRKLTQHSSLLISAPPGAGKSTLLPLALLNEPWLAGQKILMLEPRRLAAKSLAIRMSEMLGEKVGQTVGYRVRLDHCVSANTRIEILTEGVLTRMLHQDNTLDGVGAILFDEFHERSIHADLSFSLALNLQKLLRPELRLVLMSATLDVAAICQQFDFPIVESKSFCHPVEIFYGVGADRFELVSATIKTIMRAYQEQQGDILVFLPGEKEITQVANDLEHRFPNASVKPLYGALPLDKQQAAIGPDRDGKRKIVLATSIAETSLTIEGITVVVDSGYSKQLQYRASNGLPYLATSQISQDVAIQRTGRAGRLKAGVCYRLYTKATYDRSLSHRLPEIEVADLTSLALDLLLWGVTDPSQLDWVSKPPTQAIGAAFRYLESIHALDKGQATPYAQELHRLAVHPRLGHLLLQAKKKDLLPLACDLVALMQERDPLSRDQGVDLNIRLEALRSQRCNCGKSTGGRLGYIEEISKKLRNQFQVPANASYSISTSTGLLLSYAYPERIARKMNGTIDRYQLANGTVARMHMEDPMSAEEWIVIADMDAGTTMGTIHLASPVDPEELYEQAASFKQLSWDKRKGAVVAQDELRVGQLILRTSPLNNVSDTDIIPILCNRIKKDGAHLLDWNEEVTQWQNRVMCLRLWGENGAEIYPDVSTEYLLSSCDEWLYPYLAGVRRAEDLKKIDLLEALSYSLDYESQQQLDLCLPSRMEVPTGSKLKIQYHADGSQPVLAVRIQELFGLGQSPTVMQGQKPILLHLLSPGFKPVQVTSDLANFWNETYFEVKKELKRRYPKHVWPDNPWEAAPTKRTKRYSE